MSIVSWCTSLVAQVKIVAVRLAAVKVLSNDNPATEKSASEKRDLRESALALRILSYYPVEVKMFLAL
jgi:hypothetical protein